MSDGMRSGVNWIRLNRSCSVSASVEIRVVFARPGTPTTSACPPATRAIRSFSTTSFCPTIRRATWSSRSRRASDRSCNSSTSLPFATIPVPPLPVVLVRLR